MRSAGGSRSHPAPIAGCRKSGLWFWPEDMVLAFKIPTLMAQTNKNGKSPAPEQGAVDFLLGVPDPNADGYDDVAIGKPQHQTMLSAVILD